MKTFLRFLLLLCFFGQISFVHAADTIVYDDALRNSFIGGSYGATVTLNNTAPVQQGANSIKVVYGAAWQGLSINNFTGVTVGQNNYLKVAFQQNRSSADNSQPYLIVYKKSGTSEVYTVAPLKNYVAGGIINANTWYVTQVPLLDIGLSPTDLVTRVAIESNVAMTAYFDDVRFTSIVSEGTPPVIYRDKLNRSTTSGWINSSWATTVDFASTQRVYTPQYSIAADFQSPWAGLSFTGAQEFDRVQTGALRFAFQAESAGQDLYLVVYGRNGTVLLNTPVTTFIPGGVIGQGMWYQITVPYSYFAAGPIVSVSFQSRYVSRFYFDEIRFVHDDGSVIFGEGFNGGWKDYSWQSTRYPVLEATQGYWSLRVDFLGAWGDLYLENTTGVNTANRGGQLNFDVFSDTVSAQHEVYMILYGPGKVKLNPNGTLIQISNGAWRHNSINLSSMNATNQVVTGIAFTSRYPDTVFFHDVRIGRPNNVEFRFPLNVGNPYSSQVVGVMDHDQASDRVLAYNGQLGNLSCTGAQRSCLRTEGDFSFSLLDAYDDQFGGSKHRYLSYDNHSGYDYPANAGTPIHAAHDGRLCIATNSTVKDGVSLWRDPSYCPVVSIAPMQWDTYHAFFVRHSVTNLESWYLHSESVSGGICTGASGLHPDVAAQIVVKGYVDVSEGDMIACVGGFPSFGPHLHFGSYKFPNPVPIGDITRKYMQDPLGNGSIGHPNVLWQKKPSPSAP